MLGMFRCQSICWRIGFLSSIFLEGQDANIVIKGEVVCPCAPCASISEPGWLQRHAGFDEKTKGCRSLTASVQFRNNSVKEPLRKEW